LEKYGQKKEIGSFSNTQFYFNTQFERKNKYIIYKIYNQTVTLQLSSVLYIIILE